MTRFLTLLMTVIVISTLSPPPARADAADLRAGLDAMRKGDWNQALQVSGSRGSVSRDIIVWHWLREGFGSSGDVLVFWTAVRIGRVWPGCAAKASLPLPAPIPTGL